MSPEPDARGDGELPISLHSPPRVKPRRGYNGAGPADNLRQTVRRKS